MGKQARIKAREYRQAQAIAATRTAKRTRLAMVAGGFVIAGLIAAIVAVVVTSGPKDGASTGTSPGAAAVAPAGTTTGGAILIGKAEAPVRVEIYLDYLCPYCGRFEKANSGDLESLVRDGKARVELHPLAFLDRLSSGTRYSTRTANAIATVADRAPASVLAFSQALFSAQPAENSPGLSDDQIAALAVKAGVPQEVASAFTHRTFEPWIASATDAAVKSGINGTPTVKINGAVFQDLYTPGAFKQAVEAAGA